MGRLALLICVVLLSAAMAHGIRPAGTVGSAAAPSPVETTTTTPTAAEFTTPPPPAVATVETTAPSSDQQQSPLDDPYKDSKRKVPNGPDPIHNRRARWGEAPAKRA